MVQQSRTAAKWLVALHRFRISISHVARPRGPKLTSTPGLVYECTRMSLCVCVSSFYLPITDEGKQAARTVFIPPHPRCISFNFLFINCITSSPKAFLRYVCSKLTLNLFRLYSTSLYQRPRRPTLSSIWQSHYFAVSPYQPSTVSGTNSHNNLAHQKMMPAWHSAFYDLLTLPLEARMTFWDTCFCWNAKGRINSDTQITVL